MTNKKVQKPYEYLNRTKIYEFGNIQYYNFIDNVNALIA